ncbi:DUF7117 family protein [Halonotius roseus]|uniref:TFIIB-type zinc ribbon-containing protein n=1 Tax=Halonotius roseus TaxID=2511997 RepID=A0A544QR45_9EURY|nr:hypothetical protein [Halonotius roseus]TQQ81915.1 hypothetical protein EWF95_02960 [Halonotius roseus]
MKIRGQRVCQACATEWSYYETGSVACPSCGSLRSVGRDDDRQLHTDTPAALPLAQFQARIAAEPVAEYATDLKAVLREYTRKRGFINGGELQPLDDRYLTARTLLHTVDILARRREPTADAELYLLSLYETLADDAADTASDAADADTTVSDVDNVDNAVDTETAGTDAVDADSTELTAAQVPSELQEAWGLAAADAVGAYCSDLRTWLDATPDEAAATTLGELRDHVNRLNALQGDVEPAVATDVVEGARAVGRYLRTGDDDALTAARDRLRRLAQA